MALPEKPEASRAGHLQTVLALCILYFSTATTFIAVKVVSDDLPAITLSGIRFLAAAAVLAPFTICKITRGDSRLTRRQIRDAAVAGVLLLSIGQTALVWGISQMPAGLSAVIGSSAPLFIVLFSAFLLRVHVPLSQKLGVGLGLGGIAALALASPQDEIVPAGVAALVLSAMAWAAGSIYGRTADFHGEPIVALNLQLAFGGILILPWSLYEAQRAEVVLVGLGPQFWAAIAYLVTVAITSFATFTWLNRNTSSTVANTFAFVAPVLTLGLSALFFGEALTGIKIAAAGVTLAGVAMLVR